MVRCLLTLFPENNKQATRASIVATSSAGSGGQASVVHLQVASHAFAKAVLQPVRYRREWPLKFETFEGAWYATTFCSVSALYNLVKESKNGLYICKY